MCGPLFLMIAGIGLLSVGTCLGFLTAALFATGAEAAQFAKPEIARPILTTPPHWSGRPPKASTLSVLACAKRRTRLGPWRMQRVRSTASPFASRRYC
jgi:hypothetical protein